MTLKKDELAGLLKVVNWGPAASPGRGRVKGHFALEDKPSVTSVWFCTFSYLIMEKPRNLQRGHGVIK